MGKRRSKSDEPKSGQTCVRLTEVEHARLRRESDLTGESIPDLLKRNYFAGPVLSPLLSQEDTVKLFTALARIGNNLNQIARCLNSGIREGFFEEIRESQRALSLIWKFYSSKYCRCSSSNRVH